MWAGLMCGAIEPRNLLLDALQFTAWAMFVDAANLSLQGLAGRRCDTAWPPQRPQRLISATPHV